MTNFTMKHPPTTATRSAGFTLIELMITVAVIGILAGIALPNYQEYIQRSHRANARNTLIQASQWMERAATSAGTYPLSNTAPSEIPAGLLTVEGARYSVNAVSTTGATYTLTATRVAGSAQASDRCGDFVLDQANRRTVVNNAPGTSDADCWGR